MMKLYREVMRIFSKLHASAASDSLEDLWPFGECLHQISRRINHLNSYRLR